MLPLLVGALAVGWAPAAHAKRAAWGSKATAEETTAGLDRDVARGGSALRKQFGASVASAIEKTNALGGSLAEGSVDHERTKTRQGTLQRVTTMSNWGSDEYTATRQLERSKGRTAFSAGFARQGESSFASEQRSVETDGRRRPKQVVVTRARTQVDEDGGREAEQTQVFTRGRFGRSKLASQVTRVAKSGTQARAGTQFEEKTTKTWGRRTQTEEVTVSDAGVKRTVRGETKSYFGGRVAVARQEAFGQKGRREGERSLGASRQVKVGGKTWNVGRQRAERGAARPGARGR